MKILYSMILFGCGIAMNAQNVNLTAEVSNITSTKGNIKVSLYNSEDTFLKKPFKIVNAEINSGKVKVVFKGIPKGVYGAFAYQDENSNGEMDTNIVGMPTEPVVCSNKAKGFMGPPKFEDAKFEVTKDSKIELPFSGKKH